MHMTQTTYGLMCLTPKAAKQQQQRSCASPPPKIMLTTPTALLSVISIMLVALASLVPSAMACQVQPTFNTTGWGLINASGTYLVDGAAVDVNGTSIFPDLELVYTLEVAVPNGTVTLTVQGGIRLEIVATAAPAVALTVTTAASVGVVLDAVSNFNVDVTASGHLRSVQCSSTALQTLVVNAADSFIGTATDPFLSITSAPACAATVTLTNTTNAAATTIPAIFQSSGVASATFTITDASRVVASAGLSCTSCASLQVSILNQSFVNITIDRFLSVGTSGSLDVVIDNATFSGQTLAAVSTMTGAVCLKIRKNASVALSGNLLAASQVHCATTITISKKSTISAKSNALVTSSSSSAVTLAVDNSTVIATGQLFVATNGTTTALTIQNQCTLAVTGIIQLKNVTTATVTITDASRVVASAGLSCTSCASLQVSILKQSFVKTAIDHFLSVGTSGSLDVVIDNATFSGQTLAAVSTMTGAVCLKIRKNASVALSGNLLAASQVQGATTITISKKSTISAKSSALVTSSSSSAVTLAVDNSTVIATGQLFVATNGTATALTIQNQCTLAVAGIIQLKNATTATVTICQASITMASTSVVLDVPTIAISIDRSVIIGGTVFDVAYPATNNAGALKFSAKSSNFTSPTFTASLLTLSSTFSFPTSSASCFTVDDNNFFGVWASVLAANPVDNQLPYIKSGQHLKTTITSNTFNANAYAPAFAFVHSWALQGLSVRQNAARVTASNVLLADGAPLAVIPTAASKLFVMGNSLTTVTTASANPQTLPTAGSGCTTVSGDVTATAICWNTIEVVATTTYGVAAITLLTNAFSSDSSSLLSDNAVIANCGTSCSGLTVTFFEATTIFVRASVIRNALTVKQSTAIGSSTLFDALNTNVSMTAVGSALMSFETASLSSTLCNSYSSSTPTTVLCANAVNMEGGTSLIDVAVLRSSSVAAVTASIVVDSQPATCGRASAIVYQYNFMYQTQAANFTLAALSVASKTSSIMRILRSSIVLGLVSASSLTATFADSSPAGINFDFAFFEDLRYATSLTMTSLTVSMTSTNGKASAALCLKCFVKDNVQVKTNTINIVNSPVANAAIAGIIFGTLPEFDAVPTANFTTALVTGNLLVVAPSNVNPSGSASCPTGAMICGNTLSLKGTGVSNVTLCPGCGTRDPKWNVTISDNVFGIQSTTSSVTVTLCTGCVAWNGGLVRVVNQNFTVTGTWDFTMDFGGLDVQNGSGVVQWNQVRASPANVSHILDASWFGNCSDLPPNVSAICGNSAIVDMLSVDREIEIVRFNNGIVQRAGAVFCSGGVVRANATLAVVNNYFESFNTTGARVVACNDCHALGANPAVVAGASTLAELINATTSLLTVSNNTIITRKGAPTANYVHLYGSSYLSTVYAIVSYYSHTVTFCQNCFASGGGSVQTFSNTYTHLLDNILNDNTYTYLGQNYITVAFCSSCAAADHQSVVASFNNTVAATGQHYSTVRGCLSCSARQFGRIVVASNLAMMTNGYYTADFATVNGLQVGPNTSARVVRNYMTTNPYYSSSDMQAEVTDLGQECDVEGALYATHSIFCGNVFSFMSGQYYSYALRFCTNCDATHSLGDVGYGNAGTPLVDRELVIANNSYDLWYYDHIAHVAENCAGNYLVAVNTLLSTDSDSIDISFCEWCVVTDSVGGTNIGRVLNNTATGTSSSITAVISSFTSSHGAVVCNNTLEAQYYPFQAPKLVDDATLTDIICIVPNATWSYLINNVVSFTDTGYATFLACRNCFTRGYGSIRLMNHTFLSTVYGGTTNKLCENCGVSVNGELLILNNIMYAAQSYTTSIYFNDQMTSQGSHRTIYNDVLAGGNINEVSDDHYSTITQEREDQLRFCLSRDLLTTTTAASENTKRLKSRNSKYGSLLCGNKFYVVSTNYLNVIGVANFDVVQGLTHFVENNTLLTRCNINTVQLQWCLNCNIHKAYLRVSHNYALINGTQNVQAYLSGIRIPYAPTAVHYVTNNNFIGTSDKTLSFADDAAFAADVLLRNASSDPFWNIASGTFNNTIVAVNGLRSAAVSFCRRCASAQSGAVLITRNEIRRSDSHVNYRYTTAVSLCQECTFANLGVLRIWNNSVDVRNSTTVEFDGLRDFDSFGTPFRMHHNVFVGYNEASTVQDLPSDLYTATCGDYNSTVVDEQLFSYREACGNVMRAKNAVNLITYLVRGLFARSPVLVDSNIVRHQDAASTTFYGCDGCFGQPLQGTNYGIPYVEPIANATRVPQSVFLANDSYVPFATYSAGVLLLNNVLKSLRGTSATFTIMSGGSTYNAAYTAWNNTLMSTDMQRATVTLIDYTRSEAADVLVASNLITDNAAAANAAIYNVSANTTTMESACPVGVCFNTALFTGAQTSYTTFANGLNGNVITVARNHVLLDDIFETYITMAVNSTAYQVSVIDNSIKASSSIATIMGIESVRPNYVSAGSLTLNNNVVNATGRSSCTYPPTEVGSAPCTIPNTGYYTDYYTIVCRNTFSLRTDAFNVVMTRNVLMYNAITIKSNSIVADGLRNVSAVVGSQLTTYYNDIKIEDNAIAASNLGDAADSQQACSARCSTFSELQDAFDVNSTVPLLADVTTNATMLASICYSCTTYYAAISFQRNNASLTKATRYHCNHCLSAVPFSLSTSALSAAHSGFSGRPQNTLAPSLVDVVLFTGSSYYGAGTINSNVVELKELDVSTCDATDVDVCPPYLEFYTEESYVAFESFYNANLVRAVVVGSGSFQGVISIQSNVIEANITAPNSRNLGSTGVIAVSVAANPNSADTLIKSNTINLEGGSPQAFICAGLSDQYGASNAISVTSNTVTAYGNEASAAVCLQCTTSYAAMSFTSNTITAGKGTYGNGAICASCSASYYVPKFAVQDNALTFTNVTKFRGVIAYLVSASGKDVSIFDNAIAASSSEAATLTMSQLCPTSGFYLCHNSIRASYVSSTANTTLCASCSVSPYSDQVTQTLTTSYNQVQVENVTSVFTVFFDGSLSGTTSGCKIQNNHVTIKNAVNSTIVPFRVSSSQSKALVADNIFVLDNAGANVRGSLFSGSSDGSGSAADTVCIKGNVITTSSTTTAASISSQPQTDCDTAVLSNTIRAYDGTGLGSWSLLGSSGAKGTYTLDLNSVDSGIAFNSVIANTDPDTGLPSYTDGDANFILLNNSFPGKNVSVGLGGTNNKLTLNGGTFNYIVLSGESTSNANTETTVVLTGVTMLGAVFTGGLGATSMTISGSVITSERVISFADATISALVLNLLEITIAVATATRGFQVLSSTPIYLLSIVNSTVTSSTMNTSAFTQDLQGGALIEISNGTLGQSTVTFTSPTCSNGGLMTLDQATITDTTVTILDAAFTATNDLIFVSPTTLTTVTTTNLNVTGSSFAAATANTYFANNLGTSGSASSATLAGFEIVYDTSSLVNYTAFNAPTTPEYVLKVACTVFNHMKGLLISQGAFVPFGRLRTLQLYSWAGTQCFTYTQSQSKNTKSVTPSVTESPTFSDSVTPSVTLTPSLTVTPSITATASPSTSPSSTATSTLLIPDEPEGSYQLVIIACVVVGFVALVTVAVLVKYMLFPAAKAVAVTHPDSIELGQAGGETNCPTAQ